jgi:NitT/TauT family transport system substrate-binding protein
MRPIPLALALLAAAPLPAQELDRVRLRIGGPAGGASGGWYQAGADGTFEGFGLAVEILQGPPPAGGPDFLVTENLLPAFESAGGGTPTVVVAAFFQTDPLALLAHEGAYARFEDLASAPEVFVDRAGRASFWPWLVKEHGFTEARLRPDASGLQDYLADKAAVQQADAIQGPIEAREQGADPESFLLADQGWNSYAATVAAPAGTVERDADLVQRFVDASIIGWVTYLYGDNSAGNAAIIAANPDQTEDRLNEEVAQMKALGIVDAGDTLTKGIGALSLERIAAFHDLAVGSGILADGSVEVGRLATDQFVNKGVGLELKAELTGD